MKNKKIIYVLIFVVATLIVSGIYFLTQKESNNNTALLENFTESSPENSSEEKNNSQENQNGITQKMITDKFSIGLPSGWEESTSTRGVLAVAVKSNEILNNSTAEKLNFKSYFAINKDKLDGKSINEYSEFLKDFLVQDIPGFQYTKEQNATINGNPAYLIEMEFTQEGLDLKTLTALVKNGENEIWSVSFNTIKEKWNDYEEMFYDTANSFSLGK